MSVFIDESFKLKEEYLVDKNRFQFRRANKMDNLFDIAELIYKTDPYIYPFWFNKDILEAKNYLSSLLLKDNKLFSIDNFYIAYDKSNNHVVGIICAVDKSVIFSHDYEFDKQINSRYKFTIENYVDEIEKEVEDFDDKTMYICNICITESFRGMKLGSYLLGYFLEQMEKEGYNVFILDCLLHDLRAKNMFHSMGFKEMKEKCGFDGVNNSKTSVVRFLRKIGNYYPEEFQVSFMDKSDNRI